MIWFLYYINFYWLLVINYSFKRGFMIWVKV